MAGIAKDKWFARSDANNGLLDEPETLLEDKKSWAISVVKAHSLAANEEVGQFVSAVYCSTRLDIERQIENTRGELILAATCGAAWQEERGGSSSAVVQSGLTAVAHFLENFSGLVEIAKAADQQYGGLAYGTLSLLLCVFARKSKHDDAYLDAFEELSYALPRMNTLARLQPSERLEHLIAMAFADIVRFARRATEYYSSRRQRIKLAFKPEGDVLDQVRKGLSRIRDECDTFMLQQIDKLRQELAEVRVQLEITDAGVHRTERHVLKHMRTEDFEHLAKLRHLLGVATPSPKDPVATYDRELRQQFSSSSLHLRHQHPRETDMRLLGGETAFSQWWEREGSVLLLAGGTNYTENHEIGSMNWMSMGAVAVIQQLRKEGRKVAYSFARTGHGPRTSQLRTVMASLLYQLAEIHENRLRCQYGCIQDLVSQPCWSQAPEDGDDDEDFLESMEKVLLGIFSAFDREDEINIVIDRLEQCEWGDVDSAEMLSRVREVLAMLLRVIVHAGCRVKVLLTVDSWYSRAVHAEKLFSPRRKESQRLLLKTDWVQVIDDDD